MIENELAVCAREYISVFFDAFVITLLFYAISFGKKHFAYIFTFVLTLIWSIINIIYATYFSSYISLSVVGEAQSLTSLSMYKYISDALKVCDILFIFNILLFAYAIKISKKVKFKGKNFDVLFLSIPSLCLLIFFIGLKLFVYENHLTLPNSKTIEQISLVPTHERRALLPVRTIAEVGVLRGQLFTFLFDSNDKKNISQSRRAEINKILYCQNSKFYGLSTITDSVKPYDRVIFIMLETYISATSKIKFDGLEVTPYLNSLRHKQNCYCNDSVVSNAKMGTSSDGQFTYMTGLLPLTDRLTISELEEKTLPSLPKMLSQQGYKTIMTIPTEASLWSQSKICPVYGIEKLYSIKNFHKTIWLNDNELFRFAMANDSKVKPPYFHLMLSVSTHSPYNERHREYEKCKCMPVKFPKNYSPEFINYLRACHYMDHNIKMYIEHLINNHKYDNTLIVMASDHGWRENNMLLPSNVNGNLLSFFILNHPKLKNDSYKGKMNQLDVFTSVVDLLNLNVGNVNNKDIKWFGLGSSVFRKESFRSDLNTNLWSISADIITSNYFKK